MVNFMFCIFYHTKIHSVFYHIKSILFSVSLTIHTVIISHLVNKSPSISARLKTSFLNIPLCLQLPPYQLYSWQWLCTETQNFVLTCHPLWRPLPCGLRSDPSADPRQGDECLQTAQSNGFCSVPTSAHSSAVSFRLWAVSSSCSTLLLSCLSLQSLDFLLVSLAALFLSLLYTYHPPLPSSP